MKDPFEAAYEEQESPPESPGPPEEEIVAADGHAGADVGEEELDEQAQPGAPSAAAASAAPAAVATGRGNSARAKEEEEEEEEEENMGVELRKLPTGDPDKLAKMQLSSLSFPRTLRIPSLICLRSCLIMMEASQ